MTKWIGVIITLALCNLRGNYITSKQWVNSYPPKKIRPKPTEHDSAHLQLTKKYVANLRRYTAFYNGHFSRHPIDGKTDKVWIAIDNVDHTDFNLDLCIDLIWTNCQDKPALPDFQRTDLGEFLDICLYLWLESMLNNMEEAKCRSKIATSND